MRCCSGRRTEYVVTDATRASGAARYAGLWVRVLANVLDILWIGALNTVVWLNVVSRPLPPGVGSQSGSIAVAVIELGTLLPPLLIVGCWAVWGATPGKMMLGLRIVDEPTGGRPGAWQCIGRYFMALAGILCAGVGYFWIAIDRRNQGWHDKVVRTLVVRR